MQIAHSAAVATNCAACSTAPRPAHPRRGSGGHRARACPRPHTQRMGGCEQICQCGGVQRGKVQCQTYPALCWLWYSPCLLRRAAKEGKRDRRQGFVCEFQAPTLRLGSATSARSRERRRSTLKRGIDFTSEPDERLAERSRNTFPCYSYCRALVPASCEESDPPTIMLTPLARWLAGAG